VSETAAWRLKQNPYLGIEGRSGLNPSRGRFQIVAVSVVVPHRLAIAAPVRHIIRFRDDHEDSRSRGGFAGDRRCCRPSTTFDARPRASDWGLKIGVLPSGPFDAITDLAGVEVEHTTIIRGPDVRTGVTAILPHPGNLFHEKVPGAVFVGNAFGKLAGSTQVDELGEIETPVRPVARTLVRRTISIRVRNALVRLEVRRVSLSLLTLFNLLWIGVARHLRVAYNCEK
jgi:hypothetical protein